jgi:hypothetical protein
VRPGALTDGRCSGGFTPEATGAARREYAGAVGMVTGRKSVCDFRPLSAIRTLAVAAPDDARLAWDATTRA